MQKRNRIIAAIMSILAVIAVLDQLGRRPEDRDWNGNVIGVPYDFRLPTIDRFLSRLWNADDERIIVPIAFGMGWTVNFCQLKRRAQLLIA